MKYDIKEKLQKIFLKESFEEEDVVYILSRIRKIIEIDKNGTSYKKLKFYCDWALHAQIDNTNPIDDEMMNDYDSLLLSVDFLSFTTFDNELARFLEEHKLETNIYKDRESLYKFHKILVEIYSDTPLIVRYIKRRKLTIKPNESNLLGLSISDEN